MSKKKIVSLILNVRSQGINKVSQCLESLGQQLIKRYELSTAPSPSRTLNSGAFLFNLLKKAKERLTEGENLIIAMML